MTNKEAIKTLKQAIAEVEWEYPMDYAVAFDMAIDVLEYESIMTQKETNNANKIGLDGMLWQTQEECGELVKAIAKYNRARGIGQKTETKIEDALKNLEDEIADVEICIKHIKYLMGLNTTKSKLKAIQKVYKRYSE